MRLLSWCQTMVFVLVMIIMGMLVVTMDMIVMHTMGRNRCVVIVMGVCLAETLFAMEHHEVHTERVERSHEHAGQHGKVGKAGARQMRGCGRFDDAVLRIETGEERRTDQCQRTQQRCDPGNRHVLT